MENKIKDVEQNGGGVFLECTVYIESVAICFLIDNWKNTAWLCQFNPTRSHFETLNF